MNTRTGGAGSGAAAGNADSGGANGGGAGGAPDGNCGSATCDPSRVCVAYRQLGGTRVVPDANGNCPAKMHLELGDSCANDFSYECRVPMGCGAAALACSCGASTCPTGYPTCRAPSASMWLDPAASLVCELLAP